MAALAAILALCAISLAQDRVRVGVIDLESETVPQAELRVLSDRLRVELVNTGEFQVREQGFQQSGCVATECIVEVGQLLGAEKMIGGRVGKVGDVYTITLRMVDVETGALERSAVRDCECALQDVLTGVVAQVAAELAGLAWTQPLEVGEGVSILFVESTPAGGRIFINGRPRRETTPATLRNVPAGEHIVRVVREHLVAEERVRVLRDDLAKVSLSLQRPTGSVLIESEPPGASVLVDGTLHGTTPTLLRSLASGTRTISLLADDYLPWEEGITVEINHQTEILAKLQAAGYLTLSNLPADARVWLDTREISMGQRSAITASVGAHRIVAWKANHDSVATTVLVEHGRARIVEARLGLTHARRKALRRRWGVVAAALAVAVTRVGYNFNTRARNAYDEANDHLSDYRAATTTVDAIRLREQAHEASAEGNRAATKRDILYGLGGAMSTVGVVLIIF